MKEPGAGLAERFVAMTRLRTRRVALLLLWAGCAGAPGATWVYAPHPGGKTAAPLTKPIDVYLFRLAIAPGRDEEPVEGVEYAAWESH